MQTYVVLLSAVLAMCGTFVPTNGLTCFKCDFNDDKCNTPDGKPTEEICGAATTGAGAGVTEDAAVSTAAPAARFRFYKSAGKLNDVNKFDATATAAGATAGAAGGSHYCYLVQLKKDDKTVFGGGCKATDKDNDCVPADEQKNVEKCIVCDKDKCNVNNASINGLSMQWVALMSSILVARMFCQEK